MFMVNKSNPDENHSADILNHYGKVMEVRGL